MSRPVRSLAGFRGFQAGVVTPYGGIAPVRVPHFKLAGRPITRQAWRAHAQGDFVLLRHDWHTGATTVLQYGKNLRQVCPRYAPALAPSHFDVAGEPTASDHATYVPYNGAVDFDRGDVVRRGADLLLRMVPDPAAKYGAGSPEDAVVGVSWFHAVAYCLFRTRDGNEGYNFQLPTWLQLRRAVAREAEIGAGEDASTRESPVPAAMELWLAFDRTFNVHGDHRGDPAHGKIGWGRSDGDGGPYRAFNAPARSVWAYPHTYAATRGFTVVATPQPRR